MEKDIDDFLNYLIADRGYSRCTYESYQRSLYSLAHFVEKLDDELDWTNLPTDVIRRWEVAEMAGRKGSRSVALELSAVRSFYKYLIKTGRVTANPVRLLKNPKIRYPLPTFLKQSEVDNLFDKVIFPDTFEGLRDRTILMTFYHTGIRVGELTTLQLGDVDVELGELKVTGKRNKQRIIPFGKELKQVLSDYLAARRSEGTNESIGLFVGANGCPLTVPAVERIVRSYLSLVTTQKKRVRTC